VRTTTANKITIARILLVPVFVVELVEYIGGGAEVHRWLAIVMFSIAAVGDGVDGYVARRYNQRSDLGALLDPLADKLLLVLGLVILSMDNGPRLDRIPLWLTATVLCRDVILLLLMVLVSYLVGKGTARPHFTGKIATVLQMTCVMWSLFKLDPNWLLVWAWAATAFTAVSGAIYLQDGVRRLRGSAANPKPQGR
jgi:CDP-diacylglycerol--glycerol-3-phosphate 3-phosphatidyltransferase